MKVQNRTQLKDVDMELLRSNKPINLVSSDEVGDAYTDPRKIGSLKLLNTLTKTKLVMRPMLDYNKFSKWQASTNSYAHEVLQKCGVAMSLSSSKNITIADFGCSHGKNSMVCIKRVLDGFSMDRVVNFNIILNDLPENDFLQVEKCLNNPEISYLNHELPSAQYATTSFSGQTFYSQCAKDQEVDLAFSLQSLHWLENPCLTSKSLFANSSFLTTNERNSMSQEAHREFVNFLEFRAKELKFGGNLLITMLKDSSYIETICQGWLNYLLSQGYTTSQFKTVLVPAYSRSTQEVELALKEVDHLYNVIHKTTHTDGKVQVEVSTLKATTFNTLLEGVEASGVFLTSQECHQFLDRFYQSLEPDWPALEQEFHLLLLERKS